MQDAIVEMRCDIAALKVKAGVWGGLAGLVTAVTMILMIFVGDIVKGRVSNQPAVCPAAPYVAPASPATTVKKSATSGTSKQENPVTP